MGYCNLFSKIRGTRQKYYEIIKQIFHHTFLLENLMVTLMHIFEMFKYISEV